MTSLALLVTGVEGIDPFVLQPLMDLMTCCFSTLSPSGIASMENTLCGVFVRARVQLCLHVCLHGALF